MHKQDIDYYESGVRLVGHLVYDKTIIGPKPAVLIAPAFEGRNQFAIGKAEELAKLGYVAFVVDMYGEGQIAQGVEASLKLMMPVFNDRALLRKRINAAFTTVKNLEMVEKNKIAAIGFCFGGMCVLDLARSGTAVKGVVSFHGVFASPAGIPNETIISKVLLLHGYKDPQVPPEQALQIEKELDEAGVDWQLHFYGTAMHSFTDPNAVEIERGRKYDALIAKRSWYVMTGFLQEVLA